MRLDQDGRSVVQYNTGNLPGAYIVKIEGLSEDGKLVDKEFQFQIEDVQ